MNPWKKPAQGNKPNNPQPPPNTGNLPPWMKSKAQPTPTTPQSTPPPFTKPPPPPHDNSAPPPPGKSQPPWMKNKQPSSEHPSGPPTGGFKPPGMNTPNHGSIPATSGNAPPWMKGKSTIPTEHKEDEEKDKQQQLAKVKKQQEQEQLNKKKQQANQQRQRKMMTLQENHSKKRQQQDRSKKPLKKSKNSKKTFPSKSTTSFKKLLLTKTIFQKYILTLDVACSKQQQYRQKKQYQKQFIDNLCHFAQTTTNQIKKYMEQRKITQRKRNIINLEQLIIQYAVVEGINDQSGNTYFKTKNIQQLELKFTYYQIMFNIIIKLIKKSTIFRLRVPLLCRVSYKGIEFLCEGICGELVDILPSASQNYVQIHGQLAQLQKQLSQAGYGNLNRKTFLVRKIVINSSDYYILYLIDNISNFLQSQNILESPLNHVTFYPNFPFTFDNLTNLSLIASHTLTLTYTSMKHYFQSIKPITDKFKISYLNLFPLAHAIRIVYASCQGELEQSSFWTLVFEKNNEIWEMVKKAYECIYGDINQYQCQLKNKFVLSKILECMVPISFGIGRLKNEDNHSYFNKYRDKEEMNKIPIKIDNSAHIIAYPLDSLQSYEITQLFDKYIENPLKFKAAEESHILQQQFIKMSENLYLKKIDVFINKAKLLFKKGHFTQSIELIEGYQFQKGKQMQKCIIYPLLITFYMAANQRGKQEIQNQQQMKKKKEIIDENKQKQKKDDNNDKSLLKSTVSNADKSPKKEQMLNKTVSESDLKLKQEQKQKQKEKQKQKQKQKQKPKTKDDKNDYQTKMLKTFNNLLTYLSQLFEDQDQIWIHSTLYTLFAAFYSKAKIPPQNSQTPPQTKFPPSQPNSTFSPKKPQLKQSKSILFSNSYALASITKSSQTLSKDNIFKQSRAESEILFRNNGNQIQNQNREMWQIHPYHQVCMKFLEASQRICLQFYGEQSCNMAEFLLHQAEIYYDIYEYSKAENSIQQAIKIYKSSPKHAKYIQKCSVILGKSMIQLGKINKNSKIIEQGVNILDNAAEQMLILGANAQAIQIFQLLCSNLEQIHKLNSKNDNKQKKQTESFQQSNKTAKLEQYLQKVIQISFNSKNLLSLKQVIRQFIKTQLHFYSKDKSTILKKLYDTYLTNEIPPDEDEGDKQLRLEQLILQLQEEKQNFGGFLDMIRWSLSISKSKNDTMEWGRASAILTKIVGLFNQKQINSMLAV